MKVLFHNLFLISAIGMCVCAHKILGYSSMWSSSCPSIFEYSYKRFPFNIIHKIWTFFVIWTFDEILLRRALCVHYCDKTKHCFLLREYCLQYNILTMRKVLFIAFYHVFILLSISCICFFRICKRNLL